MSVTRSDVKGPVLELAGGANAARNETGVDAFDFRAHGKPLEQIMGITRAVLGMVAAAGVARLLAPAETKKIVNTAERTVRAGAKAVKRKATSMTKAVAIAKPGKKTAKTASKGKTKVVAKPRKAAKRRAPMASR